MILQRVQHIPRNIDEVWDFFSNPRNLKIITPPYMGFDIINEVPEKMYEGLLIEYRVSPLLNIPLKWISEISYIKEKEYFIDEQKVGPYKLWHHTHIFEKKDNGVLMKDIVYYELPFSPISNIILPLIENRLKEIFNYRYNKIKELFP
ncbi:MAG: SRPBCC family protein [Leptospiraceae bacterium]|nr:SRPBCC family protein [Leptospiraceae bacterium]MDW7975695.1 SRPBCC family protein [Leptospiraceae bacterium]